MEDSVANNDPPTETPPPTNASHALNIDMITRQTDYDEVMAKQKLEEHNGDTIAVIREYTGGSDTGSGRLESNTTNQRIYGEIRTLMDGAAAEHRKAAEEEERKQKALSVFREQARMLASIARLPEKLVPIGSAGTPTLSSEGPASGSGPGSGSGPTSSQLAFHIRSSVEPSMGSGPWLIRLEVCTTSNDELLQKAQDSRKNGAIGFVADGGHAESSGESNYFNCTDQAIRAILEDWTDAVVLAVSYPHGPGKYIEPVGSGFQSEFESGRALRARESDRALCVCRDADFKKSIQELKGQEDAGAHAAITEPFYDVGTFLRFIVATRQEGVTIPVIPCVRPISTAEDFEHSAGCRFIRVPPGVEGTVERLGVEGTPKDIEEYGVSLAFTAAKALMLRGVQHVHVECHKDSSVASTIGNRLQIFNKDSPALSESSG